MIRASKMQISNALIIAVLLTAGTTARTHRRNGQRFHGHPLIIKGKAVIPYDKYPFMAALLESEDLTEADPYCSGAIITPKIILTAAHCLSIEDVQSDSRCHVKGGLPKECQMKPEEVFIGLIKENSPKFSIHSRASLLLYHPEFDSKILARDIGLAILHDEIPLTKSIQPINLPKADLTPNEDQLITAGWGRVQYIQDPDDESVLREAPLTIVDHGKCREIDETYHKLEKTAFCMMGSGQSPCKGDSGGPLFVKKHGKYYVYGVFAGYIDPTCETDSPTVFTQVYPFVSWIQENLKKRFLKLSLDYFR